MAFQDPSAKMQTDKWQQGWANDGRCHVSFYKRTVLDERATHGYEEEREVMNDDGSVRIERKRFPGAGRPIYRETIFVKKFTPGDPTNVVDREKWPHDEEEFAAEWANYLKHGEGGMVGTPIEMLPGIAPTRIEELKHLPGAPVRTIEELAAMSDGVLQRFIGLHGDRDKARQFLAVAEKQAPLAEAQAQLAKQNEKIAEQNDLISQMKARLEALESKAASPKAKG